LGLWKNLEILLWRNWSGYSLL